MAVKDTSRSAFAGLTAGGGLATQEARLLAAMLPGVSYSRRQLAVAADIETSAVPGRILALIDKGAVVVVGKGLCPLTNRQVELVARV